MYFVSRKSLMKMRAIVDFLHPQSSEVRTKSSQCIIGAYVNWEHHQVFIIQVLWPKKKVLKFIRKAIEIDNCVASLKWVCLNFMFVKYHLCITVNFVSLCLYRISYSSKHICYPICPCEQFNWTVSQFSGRKNPSMQLFSLCLVWEGQSACVRTDLWMLARGGLSAVNGWMDMRGNCRLNEIVIRRLLCFNWLLLNMQTSCPIKIIFLFDLG